MIKCSIKNFLILFTCGIILFLEVKAASDGIEDGVIVAPVLRATGWLRESATHHASRDRLIAMGAEHLHDSHPRMLAMLGSSSPPTSVDLSSQFPPVFDQGQLGSCVDNALVGAVMYNLMKQGLPNPNMRSRLYLYYYARYYCGLDNDDSEEGTDGGSYISDGILALVNHGVCLESAWPYYDKVSAFPSKFTVQPSTIFDTEAATCKLFVSTQHPGLSSSIYSTSIGSGLATGASITDNTDAPYFSYAPSASTIKGFLASGVPVVCGFTCYNSTFYYMANGGVVPVPPYGKWGGESDGEYGGHCVVFAGYNDGMTSTLSKDTGKKGPGYFLMRNSWGAGVGLTSPPEHSGYFWLPYEFLTLYNLNPDTGNPDPNYGTLVNNCWTIGSAGSLSSVTVTPPPATAVDPIAQSVWLNTLNYDPISAPSGGVGPMVVTTAQILPYANLFTGGVSINNTTLTISSAAALGIDKKVEFATGSSSTLVTKSTMTLDSATKTAAATFTPASGTTLTIASLLGTGDMIVNGAGSVVVSSALPGGNYTAKTGVLKFADATSSGTGTVTVQGILDCTANSDANSLPSGTLILQSTGTLMLPAGTWSKLIVLS